MSNQNKSNQVLLDELHVLQQKYIYIKELFDKEVIRCQHLATELDLERIKVETVNAILHTTLKSMSDAVCISDLEGNFIHFSEAFASFHKFKNTDECAKTLKEYPGFLEVYLPDGKLASFDQWAVPRALRGETGTNVVYTLRMKNSGET